MILDVLGIPTSNRDPLAEFSERLVAALLSGALAPNRVQAGYDVTLPVGGTVQVKYLADPEGLGSTSTTSARSPGSTTTRWSSTRRSS